VSLLRVIVVDDHEIVREGLITTLERDGRFAVVGAASAGGEGIELAQRSAADVAIVDLRLPDMSGVDVCRELNRRSPDTSVVILTTYLSEDTVRAALNAGAAGYVTKAAGVGKLKDVLIGLGCTSSQEAPSAPSAPQVVKQLHELVSQRGGARRTTPRQERVLELAAQGLTNRGIGESMFISESTVRFHMQKLKDALDAKTRTELVAKAIRLGMIPPAPEDLRAPV
jgi:DNA-binding NarL/FixJ family response regulator